MRWHATPRVLHGSLLASAALWGLTFIGVHDLLPYLDPVQIVVVRFSILSFGFALLLLVRPELRPHLTRADWPRVLLGAAMVIPCGQLAAVFGQQHLSPALTALIVATSPAFATGFAALLLRESVTRRQAAGLTIALVGVAFITLLGNGDGTVDIRASLPGAVTVIGPASWAFYTVLAKPMTARHPPIGVVAVTMMLGTLLLVPAMPHAVGALSSLPAKEWSWLLYLALGGSFLPYVATFQALRVLPASKVVAYMYLIPFFTVGWAALLLGDLPTWAGYIGMVLVLGGVVLTQVGARAGDHGPSPLAVPGAPALVDPVTGVAVEVTSVLGR